MLPGEVNVSFLFGLGGVSTGLGSSRSSIGLPDGEKITVSWDAGMDSGISTTSFSVICGGSDGPTSCVKRSICSWMVLPRAPPGSAALCPGVRVTWPQIGRKAHASKLSGAACALHSEIRSRNLSVAAARGRKLRAYSQGQKRRDCLVQAAHLP